MDGHQQSQMVGHRNVYLLDLQIKDTSPVFYPEIFIERGGGCLLIIILHKCMATINIDVWGLLYEILHVNW